MIIKELTGCFMILLACHDIQWDPAFRFPDHIHQVLDQPLENIYLFRDTNIVHSLGIVRAKPGSHATRKKHSSDLSFPDHLKATGSEPFFLCFNLRQLHGCQRGDHSPFILGCCFPSTDQNRKVSLINLSKECLLLLFRQFVIIHKDMLLSIAFQFRKGFLIIHSVPPVFYTFCYIPTVY